MANETNTTSKTNENLLYFAYGSNLNQQDLDKWCNQRSCPRIDLVKKKPVKAILDGYELVFDYLSPSRGCGVADIKKTPGKHVEGVLFEMTNKDMEIIDRKEGIKVNAYHRETVHVKLQEGQEKDAITYIVNKRADRHVPPSMAYLTLIINGAKQFDLSPEWISRLNKFETSTGYGPKSTIS